MQVNCFPVWVVSRVECPTIRVEFIREHQRPLVIRVHIRLLGIHVFGCITIYETEISWDIRDLPRRVDSAEIKAALRRLRLGKEVS
jgi:hypothetical protein